MWLRTVVIEPGIVSTPVNRRVVMSLHDTLLYETMSRLTSGLRRRLRRGRRTLRSTLPFTPSTRAESARRDARVFLEERRRELSDALDRYA